MNYSFKRIVHPKMKILKLKLKLTVGHPRCRWISSSSEQIWRNYAFDHLLTNGTSAANRCRQNESPNCWSKHYNNPQVIYTTPVHQISCLDSHSDGTHSLQWIQMWASDGKINKLINCRIQRLTNQSCVIINDIVKLPFFFCVIVGHFRLLLW